MKKELSTLLDKKMDRLDFLRHVGFGLASVVGVGGLVASLTSLKIDGGGQSTSKPQAAAGYGASVYGGSPKA